MRNDVLYLDIYAPRGGAIQQRSTIIGHVIYTTPKVYGCHTVRLSLAVGRRRSARKYLEPSDRRRTCIRRPPKCTHSRDIPWLIVSVIPMILFAFASVGPRLPDEDVVIRSEGLRLDSQLHGNLFPLSCRLTILVIEGCERGNHNRQKRSKSVVNSTIIPARRFGNTSNSSNLPELFRKIPFRQSNLPKWSQWPLATCNRLGLMTYAHIFKRHVAYI